MVLWGRLFRLASLAGPKANSREMYVPHVGRRGCPVPPGEHERPVSGSREAESPATPGSGWGLMGGEQAEAGHGALGNPGRQSGQLLCQPCSRQSWPTGGGLPGAGALPGELFPGLTGPPSCPQEASEARLAEGIVDCQPRPGPGRPEKRGSGYTGGPQAGEA